MNSKKYYNDSAYSFIGIPENNSVCSLMHILDSRIMLTCFEKPVDEHSHGATTEGKHCISGWGSRWLQKLHIFRDNVECTIACMMSVQLRA